MSNLVHVDRRRRRKRIRLAVAIGAAAGTVAFGGWWIGAIRPLPSILATLPGSWTDADREFKGRLSDWFPAGSSEDALIETLTRQGFHPDWHRRNDPGRALYGRSGLICSQAAQVEWTANGQGMLMQVSGSYHVTCL